MRGSPDKTSYVGKRYGMLVVVEPTGKRGGSWLCKCDCGGEVILYSSDFTNGPRRGCGCLLGKSSFKHGLWKSRFYRIWDGMNRRCKNKSMINYPLYGGRGIKCQWNKFEDFVEDMYPSYLEHTKNNKTTTIERVNNNGNYCKENCRWATCEEQAKNKRTNRILTYSGRTQIGVDWARELGLSSAAFFSRLRRLKSLEKVIESCKSSQ